MKSRNCLSEWNHFFLCCVWAARIPTLLHVLLQFGSALEFLHLCWQLLWEKPWNSLCNLLLKMGFVQFTALENRFTCQCHAVCSFQTTQWKYTTISLFLDKSHRLSVCQVVLSSHIWSIPWEVSFLPPGAQGMPEPAARTPFLTHHLASVPQAPWQGGIPLSPDIVHSHQGWQGFLVHWASNKQWHGLKKFLHGPEMTCKVFGGREMMEHLSYLP